MQPGDPVAVLATIVAGAVASWLIHKMLSAPRPRDTADDREQFNAHYQRFEATVMAVWLFVLAPATSFAAWRVLLRAREAYAARLGQAEITLAADLTTLAAAAFFVGMTTSAALLTFAGRVILGDRLAAYERYQAIRYPRLRHKVIPLCVVLVALSLLLAAAVIDWYVLLTSDRLRFNNFFSYAERVQRYEDVSAIRSAPGSIAFARNRIWRRDYVICFKDGSSWSTQSHPGILSARNKTRLARFVAEKSRIPISELEVLSRADQSCESPTVPAPAAAWREAGILPQTFTARDLSLGADAVGVLAGFTESAPPRRRAEIWRLTPGRPEQVYTGPGAIVSIDGKRSRWLAAAEGPNRLLASLDAARHWKEIGEIPLEAVVQVLSGDASRVWAAGARSLRHSEDGGVNWKPLPFPDAVVEGGPSRAFLLDDAGNLLAFGSGLMRMKSGTRTWERILTAEYTVLAVDHPVVAAVVDGNPLVLRFTGEALVRLAELPRGFTPVALASEGQTIRVLSPDGLFSSGDGGKTWSSAVLKAFHKAAIAGSTAGVAMDSSNRVFVLTSTASSDRRRTASKIGKRYGLSGG